MNANIFPGFLDALTLLFLAEVLVPAAIVSCFLALCSMWLRYNRGGDAMEAFIKSGGDKLDFRAYAAFEKTRKRRANFFIFSGMLILACAYVGFLLCVF